LQKALKLKTLRVASLLLLLIPAAVSAQDYNAFYNQLLTINPPESVNNTGLTIFPILDFSTSGEQQAMAGVYTAVARDTGYFDSNPAGSALATNTEVGIFHSNIIADVNLEAATFTYRTGDLGIGSMVKLLYTPFTAYKIQGQQADSSYYVESVVGINAAYTFLRDYSFSGIAVGANLKLAYRSIPADLYQEVTSVAGTTQSAIGAMADIGLLTRFNLLKGYVSRDKNFSVGLAIRNLGPAVSGDALPTQASAGIAYSPFKFLLFSGDFVLPINLVDPSKSEGPGFGGGLALQFTDISAVRAGFMLIGGNPRFATGVDLKLEGVDLAVSYTVDYTTQLRIPDHFGIQLRFNLGDEGRAALQKRVDALYIDALVALSQSDYDKVIALCKEALDLDKGFTPASDTLKLATRSQELINKIESLRLEGQTSK
jgi:hypothetical protein